MYIRRIMLYWLWAGFARIPRNFSGLGGYKPCSANYKICSYYNQLEENDSLYIDRDIINLVLTVHYNILKLPGLRRICGTVIAHYF